MGKLFDEDKPPTIWSREECRLFCNRIHWGSHIGLFRLMWRGKRHRAIIYGYLPQAQKLQNLPDGTVLEISRILGGDVSEYRKENIIIRLSGCKIRNKWIPHPTILSPYQRAAMTLFVEVECEIELVAYG